MSEAVQAEAPAKPQVVAPPPIMVTYNELVNIRTSLAMMQGQLTAALALQGRVDNMDRRLGKVENILSGTAGERKTWRTIRSFLGGALTTAIGGGALTYLLRSWAGY